MKENVCDSKILPHCTIATYYERNPETSRAMQILIARKLAQIMINCSTNNTPKQRDDYLVS